MSTRPILSTHQAQATLEGAGVKLHRGFGFSNPDQFDPFLLFDDFRNERPEDYQAGFPWHPHRGIETITYVLGGTVEHQDSLGNKGVLAGGDLQWMTAGSGIMHQEMPAGDARGRMHGFQLWANLPAQFKMTTPRYQDIKGADLPETTDDDGTWVKVLVGEFWGLRSPVDGIAAEPQYLDVRVPPGLYKTLPLDTRRQAFAYIFEGAGTFTNAAPPKGVIDEKQVGGREIHQRDMSGNRTIVQFGAGDSVSVQAGPEGVRFLLVSGVPIREPIAWHGPIVMNTQQEIREAIHDLHHDNFIRAR